MGALGDRSWSRGGDTSELAPRPMRTAEGANKPSCTRGHTGPHRSTQNHTGGIQPARGSSAPERTGGKTRRADKWRALPAGHRGAGRLLTRAGARPPPPGRCPRSVEESSGRGLAATWAPRRCLLDPRGRPLSRPVALLSSCSSVVPSASPARLSAGPRHSRPGHVRRRRVTTRRRGRHAPSEPAQGPRHEHGTAV